jgi:hypothetical protein
MSRCITVKAMIECIKNVDLIYFNEKVSYKS